jgi:hypothetical protein
LQSLNVPCFLPKPARSMMPTMRLPRPRWMHSENS